MDIPKVTVKRSGEHGCTSKKHWWIRCAICKTKSHTHMSNWHGAIRQADIHARGKQHIKNIIKLTDDTNWVNIFLDSNP